MGASDSRVWATSTYLSHFSRAVRDSRTQWKRQLKRLNAESPSIVHGGTSYVTAFVLKNTIMQNADDRDSDFGTMQSSSIATRRLETPHDAGGRGCWDESSWTAAVSEGSIAADGCGPARRPGPTRPTSGPLGGDLMQVLLWNLPRVVSSRRRLGRAAAVEIYPRAAHHRSRMLYAGYLVRNFNLTRWTIVRTTKLMLPKTK